MSKKSDINIIIALLNEFFNEENSLSFSLFSWQQNKGDTVIINFKFSYQIKDSYKMVESNGEYLLFENIYLNKVFLNCKNTYDLSEKIVKRLEKREIEKEDLHYFNYLSGIEFNKVNWKDTCIKVFGAEEIATFFSHTFKKHLEKKLPCNKHNFLQIDKKTKI